MRTEQLATPQTSFTFSPATKGKTKGVFVYDLAGFVLPEGHKHLSTEELTKIDPFEDAIELLRIAVHLLSEERVIACSRADPRHLRERRANWVTTRVAPVTGVKTDSEHLRFTDSRPAKGSECLKICKQYEEGDHSLIVADNSYDVGLGILEAFEFCTITLPGGKKSFHHFPSWLRFYLVKPSASDLARVRENSLGMRLVEKSCLEIASMEGW